MDYIGGLAGGTLGYITSGTRGARKGANLGYNFAKAKYMPPVKRKYSSATTAGTRRRGWTPKMPLKKRKVTGGYNPRPIHSYNGVGSNASAVAKAGRKLVVKKKRRVKVSKTFKRKVQVALDDHLYGKYTKIDYGHVTAPISEQNQRVVNLSNFFSPIEILHATDILFNRATPLVSPTLANITWSANYIRKDWIVNSKCEFLLKNSSQRTYTVILYECAPKSLPTQRDTNSAFDDWDYGLDLAQIGGTNPQANGPETLFSVPQDSPQFNQYWRAKKTKIVLQPGQEHTFFHSRSKSTVY